MLGKNSLSKRCLDYVVFNLIQGGGRREGVGEWRDGW